MVILCVIFSVFFYLFLFYLSLFLLVWEIMDFKLLEGFYFVTSVQDLLTGSPSQSKKRGSRPKKSESLRVVD